MRKGITKIECPTRNFFLDFFEIDPAGEDKNLVNTILDEVHKHSAVNYAPSGQRRSSEEVTKTRYLGVLAERLFVTHLQAKLGRDIHVSTAAFVNYEQHVDIEIEAGNRLIKLEVRSSFPYSPLEAVVCQHFDVIGPYSTSYKQGESPKEFYLRGLINEDVRKFDYMKNHRLYFAGGAPYELLKQRGRRDNFKQRGAEYLALSMVEAMDAKEIIDAIRSAINAV